MASMTLNSSSLEQLALKGLKDYAGLHKKRVICELALSCCGGCADWRAMEGLA